MQRKIILHRAKCVTNDHIAMMMVVVLLLIKVIIKLKFYSHMKVQ